MKDSMILKALRVFFGVFMIVVYLCMAVFMAMNIFDWDNTMFWRCARWFMAVVFGLYGFYRCYRLVKGIDYYHHER